jgi:hypothetical protein
MARIRQVKHRPPTAIKIKDIYLRYWRILKAYEIDWLKPVFIGIVGDC